jgi:hypothetical protein
MLRTRRNVSCGKGTSTFVLGKFTTRIGRLESVEGSANWTQSRPIKPIPKPLSTDPQKSTVNRILAEAFGGNKIQGSVISTINTPLSAPHLTIRGNTLWSYDTDVQGN